VTAENPFLLPPSDRNPVRRLRGRLATPVTVLTAGSGAARTGITVSSLVVVEGEPGVVRAVVGPVSELWDRAGETGKFVLHVCDAGHQALADVFALLRPSPGGLFAGTATTPSEWGPVIEELPDRAFCTVTDREVVGWSGMITATIDRVEVADLTDPLTYFRGSYRRLR